MPVSGVHPNHQQPINRQPPSWHTSAHTKTTRGGGNGALGTEEESKKKRARERVDTKAERRTSEKRKRGGKKKKIEVKRWGEKPARCAHSEQNENKKRITKETSMYVHVSACACANVTLGKKKRPESSWGNLPLATEKGMWTYSLLFTFGPASPLLFIKGTTSTQESS